MEDWKKSFSQKKTTFHSLNPEVRDSPLWHHKKQKIIYLGSVWFRNCSVIWRNEKIPCYSVLRENARKLYMSLIVHKKYKLVGMVQTSFYASRLFFLITKEENFIKRLAFFRNRIVCLPWTCSKHFALPAPTEYWRSHCTQRAAKSIRTNSRKMRNKQINSNNVEQRNMGRKTIIFFRLGERLNTANLLLLNTTRIGLHHKRL